MLNSVLGAFATQRKENISFVMSVSLSVCLSVCLSSVCLLSVSLSVCSSLCLSICIEELGSLWRDFNEILYLMMFRKSAEKKNFD